ncbi:condensation domain-containing protein [uncultured Corynebacterium sp.]|uniref:condensation domain-containing protein n=1 Tax=uncultured Corynebacterium sp. TaxID=159447 RepID=UPI0025E4B9D9|nr:condensation domain-containing protein [uncultured Corynebacterium sp.]
MSLLDLGAAQRGIWNAQLLDPTSPYYVVGEVLELDGLTPGAGGENPADLLAEAVRLTVDESETLRLRFTATADGPRQSVDDTPATRPEIRDLSGAPDPVLLARAVVDAEKASCGERWCTMTDGGLHRHLILDLGWTGGDPADGRSVWCVQLYHHIIVDGYSAALLTRRTAAHYTELAGGRAARPNRFAPIAEVIGADLAYAADPAGRDADRGFWRDYLTPVPDTTGREDHVHGAGTTSVTTTLRLSAGETAALRARAEAAGLVWSDLVMAAYAAWLRKFGHTGAAGDASPEVLLSMPMMARTSGPLRRTPAMLVNMLPLRFPVAGTDTLEQVAASAHAALDKVRPHQRYPGSELARDLRGAGGPAVLHGIGLNLKTFDFSLDFNGTTGVLRNVAGGPPEDLVLVVTPAADGGMDLGFETDPQTVSVPTARQRLEDIRAFLHCEGPLADVRLRDATFRTVVAADRAGAELPEVVPTLDELIDRLGAHATGDSSRTTAGVPLLVSDDAAVSLTAAEVHRRITELVGQLSTVGGAGAVIALDLPKGPALAVAVLATWRAHRAFVILDREHPAARRAHILADSGALAVLGEDGLHATGTVTDSAAADSGTVPDLAYLLYTSGTTGVPKGVEVTRSAVESLLAGHAVDLWPDARSRSTDGRPHVAHTASFSFDAALDQLAWIFTGATVHLYDHGTVGDPAAMRTVLRRDRITVLDATPSLAGALIDSGALDDSVASTVSTVILGGEALPASLWDRLAASEIRAWNVYGPTEATVDALIARVTPGPVTIGRAVPGMTALILDVDGEPVPDNEVGELVLAGPQVALGYRGLPEQTARVFGDGTGGADSQRTYRTGDLVRWVPGRGTVFLGRADDQLEIRGHRVEPGEVEAALLALPQVTSAAVGTFGAPGALKLIAHVSLTPAAATQVPPFDVRAAVAETVPAHLVPTRVRLHERLPLTVGGKVDRRALTEMTETAETAGTTPDAAFSVGVRTDAEQALADVLAEVLGLGSGDLLPLDRDFIGLGGDSIGALTAAGRLRRRGYGITAKDLLAGTGLADVAAAAEQVVPTPTGDAASGGSAATAVRPTATAVVYPTGAFPVTPVPARAALTGTVHAPGVDHDRLLTAVTTMMTTHPALRAVLDLTTGTPQIIIPRTPLTGPDAVIAGARRLTGADLDPQRGLVWRITGPDDEGELQVLVHRSVLDPDSAATFLGELERALAALPLRPATGSWRAAALAGCPVEPAPVAVDAPEPLVLDVPDRKALFTLLPDLFHTTPAVVVTAAAALATGGPVGLRHRAGHSGTGTTGTVIVGDLSRTDLVPASSGSTRAVLLQVKETLAAGGTGTATDRPTLTVGVASCRMLPSGPALLTDGAPHLLVTDDGEPGEPGTTGTALLYNGTPELAARITGTLTDLAVLARTTDGGASPADLHTKVSQAQIDTWERRHGPLADVLPVSPLQEGLLYHALSGGAGYVLSAGIDLHGPVDPDRLHTALRATLARHDLLRARFDTGTLDEPVQLIPRGVDLPWRTVDLRDLPTAAATTAADERLRIMATRRIDLASGPLVAAELILLPGGGSGTGGVTARLVLGNHHLLTDGWSTPVMVRDLLALYHGDALPTAAPFADHLDWLAGRDASGETAADDLAWRGRLGVGDGGTVDGTIIHDLAPATAGDLERAGTVTRETVDELTVPESLAQRARTAGVTGNTLLQAAWALTLTALTGREDVLFGTTVSGRPTQLPGIEQTVGLFINTLPVRVTLDDAARAGTVTDLLRGIGRTQAAMTAHESTPLVRVEQLAGGGPLFDTLVVFDNFPSLPRVAPTDDRIGVADVHVDGMTSFPLSCVAPPTGPGEPMRVVLAHRPDLVDAAFVALARDTLTRVLVAFVDDPTVGEVLAGLPRWERRDAAPLTGGPGGSGAQAAQAAHAAHAVQPAQGEPASQDPMTGATGATEITEVTEVTATVARVMASLLKKDHMGDHDNFFDIGGHSLLAMRLLGRLRREGLDRVTIQDIVETGSPTALAARLTGGGSSQILPLGPGSRTPVFAVHPGGGFALPFRGLAERLAGHDIPVTGLQLPDPHPEVPDLAELAAGYVDSVRQVQPHGPYRLLGYSFGGVLAQAMTAELMRRGEEVSWLGVMDAYPSGAGPLPVPPGGTPELTAAQIAAVAGVPDLDDLPGGAEAAGMIARTLGTNLAYCDALLRSAEPVDLADFGGEAQLIIATRADERVTDLQEHRVWDPASAWADVLPRTPRTLTLDLTHAALATDAGWDAITPVILEGLQ